MQKNLYLLFLDNLKRKYYFKKELQHLILISSLMCSRLNFKFKQFISLKFKFSYFRPSITNLKLRCGHSGRAYAVNKLLTLSRFNTRRFINNGIVPGYKRASW